MIQYYEKTHNHQQFIVYFPKLILAKIKFLNKSHVKRVVVTTHYAVLSCVSKQRQHLVSLIN